MRKVFDNAMVAHVWAHQSQDEGRNSGDSFYFNGPTLYSYGSHFPVGVVLVPGRVVALNSDGYSMTTAQHKNKASSAVRHYPVRVYADTEGMRLLNQAARRTDQWTDAERDTLLRALADCDTLANDDVRAQWAYEITRRECQAADVEVARVRLAELREKERQYLLEQRRAAAKRSRDAARARKVQAEEDAIWMHVGYADILSAAHRGEAVPRRYVERAEWSAAEDAFRPLSDDELAEFWRRGINLPSLYQPYTRTSGHLMRIAADGTHIETTGGARVHKRFARLLWAIYAPFGAAAGEVAEYPNVEIGPFRGMTIRVQDDGTKDLHIGCHRFAQREVERMAVLLGLVEPATVEA